MNLNQRCFCVVSGASRGIGRCFAIELSKKFAPGSHLVLLARNETDLLQIQREVQEVTSGNVTVAVEAMDLQQVDQERLKQVLVPPSGPFDLAICVHNVGTVGDIERWAATESDVAKWSAYFQVNLFNVILLNNLFLEATQVTSNRLVLNVTSLCALEAMKSLAYYCTGKAAREMFFRVLALENPSVTVLNYSPGMVDTEMAQELRTKAADEGLKQHAQETYEKKALLTPLQTTQRMIQVVEGGKYKSGDHVDYHDE